MPRDLLCQLLAGNVVDVGAMTTTDVEVLLARAHGEGVQALLGECLPRMRDAPASLVAGLHAASQGLAAASLLLQAECRRTLRARPAGSAVLLLKGSALACWLYPQPYLRECSDIDLLLPTRSAAEQLADALRPQGYAMQHVPAGLAHELLCRRTTTGGMQVDLDVHWALLNAPLFADVLQFDELHEASIALPKLGADARGLCAVHALLHACLHRAINISAGIGDRLKWLYDVHLLVQHLDASEWDALLSLCDERRVSGICAAGIDAAADAFGDIAPAPALARLRMQAARGDDRVDAARLGDWRYMQSRNLAALPGWSMRLRWLWQGLNPPTGYMDELYGPGQGRMALLWQRARRAVQRLSG